MHGLMHVSGT